MELTFDIEQLNKDIADLDHFKYEHKYLHKRALLKLISQNKDEVTSTLGDAIDYVNGLKVIQCGAIHENLDYWKNPVDCENLQKNVACTHALKFATWGLGLLDGYKIFGFQLFAIAYFLHQKGTKDLQWYIPDEDFESQSNEDNKFDSGIRSYYANGESINNKINPLNLKERQLKVGNMRIEKYVEPVKIALEDYMEQVGYIVEDQNTYVINFV